MIPMIPRRHALGVRKIELVLEDRCGHIFMFHLWCWIYTTKIDLGVECRSTTASGIFGVQTHSIAWLAKS